MVSFPFQFAGVGSCLYIPYSGKFWGVLIFTVFADQLHFAKASLMFHI